MSLQDAANLITVARGEKDILNDPSLTYFGKMRALTVLQNASAAQPASKPWLTSGDVVRGAVGAGVGYGFGTLLGKMLGVNPGTLQNFRNLGMGLGTLINTGVMKMSHTVEDERRHAFRLGFVKAALDLGLIKEAGSVHPVLPLGPELISAPINAGVNLGSSIAADAGALAGQITGEDATDVDMSKMQLEERQLNDKADMLENQRRQQALRGVLNKRIGRHA